MSVKPTLTLIDRPGPYRWTREYVVTVDGVVLGEVRNAKHSGAHGTTYWFSILPIPASAPGGRQVREHRTRAQAVERLVAVYLATAAQAA